MSRNCCIEVAVGCLAQLPSEHLEFVKQLAHKLACGLVGQPTCSVEFLVCSVYQDFWLEHGICVRGRKCLPPRPDVPTVRMVTGRSACLGANGRVAARASASPASPMSKNTRISRREVMGTSPHYEHAVMLLCVGPVPCTSLTRPA